MPGPISGGSSLSTIQAWWSALVAQGQVVTTINSSGPDGVGNRVVDVADVQAASGITPIADGTVTPITSITTVKGITTAAS